MDRLEKALKKLSQKEKERIKKILEKIIQKDFDDLDLVKLVGENDIFRVRKGNLRIIFYKKGDKIKILAIERRSTRTYKR